MDNQGTKIHGSNITIVVEPIDAKGAAYYLTRNISNNRNVRPRAVQLYAADMLNGTWQMTSDTIKFDVNGNLFDGQHRLSAVIEADKQRPGIIVNMMVARGVDASAMIVVDRGAQRRPGDAVRISGIDKYESAKAALAKRILLLESGTKNVYSVGKNQSVDNKLMSTITMTQVVDYVQRNNEELEHFAGAGLGFYDSQIVRLMTPSDWGLTYWVLAKTDAEGAKYFLGRLATLEDVPKESPIRMLFQHIQKLKAPEKLDEILRAFDAYCRGKARYIRDAKAILPANLFNQR